MRRPGGREESIASQERLDRYLAADAVNEMKAAGRDVIDVRSGLWIMCRQPEDDAQRRVANLT